VEKEVIKEVPVEKVVEKEVIKEVPVEKVVEVKVQWPDVVTFAAKPPGAVSYVVAAGLTEMYKKHLGISASVEIQKSSATIAKWVNTKEVSMGFNEGYNLHIALLGIGPYKERGGPMPNLRLLTSGHLTFVPVVARKGSGIETYADLKGKRWMADLAISPPMVTAANAILEALGLTKEDLKFLKLTGPQNIVDAIRENRIDAAFYPLAKGSAWIEDLTSTGHAYLVPMDENTLDYILDKVPFFPPITLKAGMFKGMDEDVPCIAMANPIVVHKELPTSLVYEMAKAMWDNFDEFLTYQEGTIEMYRMPAGAAVEKMTIPYHEGTVKYLKEKGFWTAKHEAKQKQLLSEIPGS